MTFSAQKSFKPTGQLCDLSPSLDDIRNTSHFVLDTLYGLVDISIDVSNRLSGWKPPQWRRWGAEWYVLTC